VDREEGSKGYSCRLRLSRENRMGKHWSSFVTTLLGLIVIIMLVMAHFIEVYAGVEIWLEIPVIIGLVISVWIVEARRINGR